MSVKSSVFHYDIVYQHAEEGGYVAFVPTLPGCHTQGETLEETRTNIEEAILLYLETMTELGEEILPTEETYHGVVEIPRDKIGTTKRRTNGVQEAPRAARP